MKKFFVVFILLALVSIIATSVKAEMSAIDREVSIAEFTGYLAQIKTLQIQMDTIKTIRETNDEWTEKDELDYFELSNRLQEQKFKVINTLADLEAKRKK